MSDAATHDLAGTVGLLGLLADPTRLRLLCLLDGAELSVAELTRITDLPQSRVSTHLGRLRAAGLLVERRAGNSTRLTLDREALPVAEAELWSLVHARTGDRLLLTYYPDYWHDSREVAWRSGNSTSSSRSSPCGSGSLDAHSGAT